MPDKLKQVISDMKNGTVYRISSEKARIQDPDFRIPDSLTPLLKAISETPITLEKPPFRLSTDIRLPDEIVWPEGKPKGLLINGRFILFGIEDAGILFHLAVDTQSSKLPVVTLDFLEDLPEELKDERNDGETGGKTAEILETVAPDLKTFLEALAAVKEHYCIPLYRTPPRTEHETNLKNTLETIMGSSLSETWWPGRLSEGQEDYFWLQYRTHMPESSYQETVKNEIDAEEALFSLFSVIPFRREKGVKYFTVIEESRYVPLLFDIIADQGDNTAREHIIIAICNCRKDAVPYLLKAVKEYPSDRGRKTAAELLRELEYPEVPELQPSAENISPIIELEWPPFDESDLSGVKYISLLVIFLGALVVGGIFYVVNNSVLSMIFGAAAVVAVSFFLPDFGAFLLKRKLAAYGYENRLTDFASLKTAVEEQDVIRCIDYTKNDIASSQGYLVYLKSDLKNGPLKPRILLCAPEEYSKQVIQWYESGAIPADGPRSPEIKDFWERVQGSGFRVQ